MEYLWIWFFQRGSLQIVDGNAKRKLCLCYMGDTENQEKCNGQRLEKSQLAWQRRHPLNSPTLGGADAILMDASKGANQLLTSPTPNVQAQRYEKQQSFIQKPSQLISKKYNELSFDGEYLKLLAKPAEGFKLMLSAAPGVGKTYWAQ